MKPIKSNGKTNTIITTYVIQWLDTLSLAELEQKVQVQAHLVEDLRSIQPMVKTAKRFISLEVDADDLLVQVSITRPKHAEILAKYRTWYDLQIAELRNYIESL